MKTCASRLLLITVALLLRSDVVLGQSVELNSRKTPSADDLAITSETAIRQALSKRLGLELREQPLAEVIERLGKELEIEVGIDRTALEAVGVPLDSTVTLRAAHVTARSALEATLKPLDLTWAVRYELLWITTIDEYEQLLDTKVYDVADLVGNSNDATDQFADFAELVDLITATLDPSSWDDVGGAGSCQPFQTRGICVLVVSQVRDVHEQIETLLAGIRAHRRAQAPAAAPPISASGETSATPQAIAPDSTQEFSAARANNQLAFDLYTELRKQQQENLLFSPHSISSALAIAYAGANGETADGIAKVLHADLPADEFHSAAGALRTAIGHHSGGNKLAIANRIWGQTGSGFLESYLAVAKSHYGADLVELDLRSQALAAGTINEWGEQQTLGKIRDLVAPGDLGPLVITNAIYFRGKWAKPFDPASTSDAPFDTGRETVTVRMMSAMDRCRYGTASNVQILEKPYLGGDLSLVVLLPPPGLDHLTNLARSLNADTVHEWLRRLRLQQAEVFLPRFKTECKLNLSQPLESLGMGLAFRRNEADFSRMNGGADLFLANAIHAAIIEVDEEGTEAAAATALGGFGAGPSRSAVFNADHPFVYLIRHVPTGTIVFFGVMIDPR